jgi:hypothetical protein
MLWLSGVLPAADGPGLPPLSISSPTRGVSNFVDTPSAHRSRENLGGATPGASAMTRTEAHKYKAEVQRLKFQLRTSEGALLSLSPLSLSLSLSPLSLSLSLSPLSLLSALDLRSSLF